MKHNYIIVGAGPAGLQMAFFLQKAGLDYVILESASKAGFFYKTFPKQRTLISINKKYNYFPEKTFNLRHDWNSLLSDNEQLSFTSYSEDLFPSADDLYQYLNDFAEFNELNIKYNTEITLIDKENNGTFILKCKDGTQFQTETLLMATGARRQNMPSEIEGIEHTISYEDVSAHKEPYINKRIAILGGGNSAFETANHLADVAANVHVFIRSPLKMAYETHFVGNLRAKYTNMFDMYQLKSLHAILKPRIKKITKLENGNLQTQHEYDFADSKVPGTLKLTREYEYIINCTGFQYTNSSLFADHIKPKEFMEGKFFDLTETWESTNVKNLYFIGTLMQAIDRKASSGFIHGFRYNIRTLSNLLMEKNENKAYPSKTIALNPFNEFLKQLYERFSIGDAIFQLYGFLGDLLVLNDTKSQLEWFEDLPIGVIKNKIQTGKHSLQLTLEFGFHHYPGKSSMEFMGPSDPHATDKSAFLHPVIRHFYQGQVDEFHFGDSLLGRWDMPHAEGGAIGSYHVEFYNWMANIFDIDQINPKDLGENPNFVRS
mgnify:CR=1 FL=1|jgi:thioredoxin reductase